MLVIFVDFLSWVDYRICHVLFIRAVLVCLSGDHFVLGTFNEAQR